MILFLGQQESRLLLVTNNYYNLERHPELIGHVVCSCCSPKDLKTVEYSDYVEACFMGKLPGTDKELLREEHYKINKIMLEQKFPEVSIYTKHKQICFKLGVRELFNNQNYN